MCPNKAEKQTNHKSKDLQKTKIKINMNVFSSKIGEKMYFWKISHIKMD